MKAVVVGQGQAVGAAAVLVGEVVLLTNNYLLALVLLLGWAVDEIRPCDTKWIRLVYMMSCGKKKRESVWAQNDTFFENLPSDFDSAFRYYKEKDPFNPMFHDALFYEILQEDGDTPRVEHRVPKLLTFDEGNAPETSPLNPTTTTTTTTRTSKPPQSLLIKKLFPNAATGNHLGIQGFPEQWDIEEIVDEKINENHRREIDRLIEECCKVPPVTACNGNTFSGACK